MITDLDTRLRALESVENGCRAVQDLKTKALEANDDAQDRRISKLEDQVKWMTPWVGGMRWAILIIGSLLAGMLWSIFTGQWSLMIK